MGYPVKYSGPKIDELLTKIQLLPITANGWILLTSTVDTPVMLSGLKNPGNYMVHYWTDGPTLTEDIKPLNIIVVRINTDIYQFATLGALKFKRYALEGGNNFTPWSYDDSKGAVNPGPTAPTNPNNGTTLWLDTSDVANPTFKIYINDGWVDILPANVMLKSVYDTTGKNTDVFEYITTKITEAGLGLTAEEIRAHFDDAIIHTTKEEKTKWNNAATEADVTAATNAMKTSLKSEVTTAVSADIGKVNALNTNVTNYRNEVKTHTNNTTIHPNATKQAAWDKKAAGDHGHNLDGRVKVYTDNVFGEIPIELIPYEAKERGYIVHSLEEMYKMPKNPLHNGDLVCVEPTPDSINWYIVIDDTYLGNTEEEIELKSGIINYNLRTWQSACYGKDKFVAISYSNIFAYSLDGITWIEVIVGNTNKNWISVCYGKDKFVAIARNDTIFAYSLDGITWIEVTIGSTIRGWYSVCYGKDKFVVIANYSNYFAYSLDGITWIESTINSTSRWWISVCYGKDKFVVIDKGEYGVASNIFAYSLDGITWIEVTVGSTNRNWNSTCYGKDKFVAVAQSTNIFAYSLDGITWIESTISSTNREWGSVCYGKDKFVAMTDSNIFAYSLDGITWIEVSGVRVSNARDPVCYGKDQFISIELASGYTTHILFISKASKAFKPISSVQDITLTWEALQNKPTTISGFGITDAVTKDAMTALETQVTQLTEKYPSTIEITNTLALQQGIADVTTAVADIEATITNMNDLVTRMENFVK